MRSLFLLLLIISCGSIYSQTTTSDRVVARQGIYLRDKWVDSFQNYGLLNSTRAIPTSKLVHDSTIANQGASKQSATAWIDSIKANQVYSKFFGTRDTARALRAIVNGKLAMYLSTPFMDYPTYTDIGPSSLLLGYRAGENIAAIDYVSPTDATSANYGRNLTAIGGGALQNYGRVIDPDSSWNRLGSATIVGAEAGYNLQYGGPTDYGRTTLYGVRAGYLGVALQGCLSVGAYSMERASKAINNTVVGISAGRSMVNANYNTFMGASAGYRNSGSIGYATVTNGGSGYTTATVTITPPRIYGASTMPFIGEFQATAHAIISGGVITSIVIDDPGGGYSSTYSTTFTDGSNNPPTVSITGDGTGATATVTVTNGDYNTYIGHVANWFYRSGQWNTAIGGNVGNSVARYADTGTTLVGAQAQVDAAIALGNHLINATAIGYKAKIAQSNTVILGDSAQLTKTGIGTEYPDSLLTVKGSANITNTALTKKVVSDTAKNMYVYVDNRTYNQRLFTANPNIQSAFKYTPSKALLQSFNGASTYSGFIDATYSADSLGNAYNGPMLNISDRITRNLNTSTVKNPAAFYRNFPPINFENRYTLDKGTYNFLGSSFTSHPNTVSRQYLGLYGNQDSVTWNFGASASGGVNNAMFITDLWSETYGQYHGWINGISTFIEFGAKPNTTYDRINHLAVGQWQNFYGSIGNITVADMMGLYVAPMASAGVTRAWGVYQEGTSDRNYLAGQTLFGDTTIANADGAKVYVNGTAKVSILNLPASTAPTSSADASGVDGDIKRDASGNLYLRTSTQWLKFTGVTF